MSFYYTLVKYTKVFGVSTDYLLNDDFESDNDIPAVQEKSDSLTQKFAGMMYSVIGGIISAISATGLLIMAILSSFDPSNVSYPSAEADGLAIVKTGLPAYLEMNGITWLFVLCIILFFVGLFIAIYPRLRSHWVKK